MFAMKSSIPGMLLLLRFAEADFHGAVVLEPVIARALRPNCLLSSLIVNARSGVGVVEK